MTLPPMTREDVPPLLTLSGAVLATQRVRVGHITSSDRCRRPVGREKKKKPRCLIFGTRTILETPFTKKRACVWRQMHHPCPLRAPVVLALPPSPPFPILCAHRQRRTRPHRRRSPPNRRRQSPKGQRSHPNRPPSAVGRLAAARGTRVAAGYGGQRRRDVRGRGRPQCQGRLWNGWSSDAIGRTSRWSAASRRLTDTGAQ